jgi:hypothetical protein
MSAWRARDRKKLNRFSGSIRAEGADDLGDGGDAGLVEHPSQLVEHVFGRGGVVEGRGADLDCRGAGRHELKGVVRAGDPADAVCLINTLRGMAVDWRRRRPILAYDVGGLSGPAIKPIALRTVWEVARGVPGLPIIGVGGIAGADDALEFMVAGASAVQVGTATFYNPAAAENLLDDLDRRLDEAGVASVAEVVGSLRSNRS